MTDIYPSRMPAPASPVLSGNLICFAAMLFFALSFPLADILLGEWGPFALIGARNAVGFVAIFLAWRMFERGVAIRSLPWMRGFWIGAIGFGAGSTLLLLAQSMTDAVTISLVVAVMPLVAVGLEVLLDGRRLTGWFIAGLVLVLVGGALATGESVTQAQVGPGLVLGVLSAVFYAWGSRAAVKNLPGLSALTQTMVTTFGMAMFGIVALCLGSLMGWQSAQIAPLSGHSGVVFAVYALLGLAVSQVMWVAAVGRIGVGLASFHTNAVPFYVMVIAVAFGGSWNSQQLAGVAVVVTGVMISQRRRRDRVAGRSE